VENAEEYYTDLLEKMRAQGSHDNPETLFIGEMLSSTSVEVDGLKLTEDDFYIPDYLKAGYSMPLVTPYVYNSNFNTSGSVKRSGSGLKKGDKVAIMKCENNDTYVVLCKVVSP